MPGIKAKRKQLVRKTLMRAKAQGKRAAEQRQESPEEYAQTEVQQGISDVAARTGNTAKSTARMSYRKFRAMQEKRKNLTLQGSTQSASKPTEKEKVTVPTQTERRKMFKKQRFRQKAIAAKTPAPQAPVPPSATPAPPPYQAQMQQHLKRQHLTREAVRRYLQKQTAATAAGNTAPIVTHAPKLPTSSNKQATVEAISRGVHYIAAKIKALLSQTVRRAAGSLLALLGAGGVVLLLAMVIGAAAAVIGSPMGILFADESGEPNSIPIAEIVAETNADFGTAINDIVSAHPECSETTMEYDYEDGHTWAGYWPEVLAVFAVHTNLNSDSDVVVINAAQKQRILGVSVRDAFCIERKEKPLAPKTIREYVLFANQVLHFANERYHSVQAEFKKPEKGTRPRFVDCIHEDEVKKLMAEISKYPIQEQAIVLSLLNTGVRRAELAGLTWSDFNFRDCTVHVNKSLLVFKDFGYQHTTTKESNDRYIDVAPEYMTFMQRYKEWWDTKKKLMGASWQRDMVTNKEDKRESLMKLVGQEFVIIDDFGWPRNPDGYNKLVKRVAQKAGISDIHPHMFRHTFVSLLMSNPDIGVATVAAEAGHAQPSTTLMIYTQQYKKRRESIRNQLSRELYEK